MRTAAAVSDWKRRMRSRVLYSWCCIFDIRITKDMTCTSLNDNERVYRIWEIPQKTEQYSTNWCSTVEPHFLFYCADAESKFEIFRLPFPGQLLLSIPCLHRFIIYRVSGENSFNFIPQVSKQPRRNVKIGWSIFKVIKWRSDCLHF